MKQNTKDKIQNLKQYFKPKTYNNSFLFSFEGIEGSGKSSQIQNFTAYLENKGMSVSYFREPGGTVFGEKLRSAILESETPVNKLAEAHLFASSRAQLLSEKVIPLLEKPNQIVILDRFIDSSIAYQGHARGLGVDIVLDIHKYYPLNLTPHKTFYLKIDLETSMQRQQARGNAKDYFEKENNLFYTNLIQGYDLAAEYFPERIAKIDGTNSLEEVSQEIISTYEKILIK